MFCKGGMVFILLFFKILDGIIIFMTIIIKGAYWIIQRFLVHYQILPLSNIAILDFSLLLPIKLSLFQLLLLLALEGDSDMCTFTLR